MHPGYLLDQVDLAGQILSKRRWNCHQRVLFGLERTTEPTENVLTPIPRHLDPQHTGDPRTPQRNLRWQLRLRMGVDPSIEQLTASEL